MLSKVSRSLASRNAPIKNLVLLQVTTRDFSIENIGKWHEKPWDYKKRRYGMIGQICDSTLKRLGDNSLIITVDGNFGSGKSEFAKKLAKEIDFVYAREPDLDSHMYMQPNGYSLKDMINETVGDNQRYRIDSLEDWHKNPSFKTTISLQHHYYNIRWMQMRTALLHLMSTGQGVVLERSVFSDSVIAQSLYDNNFLSDEAFRFYMRDVIPNTINELWRPHVTVYLEKRPEDCYKSIQDNGKPFEKESKVYTMEFLQSMDKNYKKKFLPAMRNELHVLTYNAADADTEKTVEDLETLDFEDQTKFNDWRIRKETTINTYRAVLSDHQDCMDILQAPSKYIDVPEYLLYGDDLQKLLDNVVNDERLSPYRSTSPFGLDYEDRATHRNWL